MKQQYINKKLKRKFKKLKNKYEEDLGFGIDLKEYFRHLLNIMEDKINEVDSEIDIEGLEAKGKRVKKKKEEKVSPTVIYIYKEDKKRFTKLKKEYERKMGDFFENDKVEFIAVLIKLGLEELDLKIKDLIEEN